MRDKYCWVIGGGLLQIPVVEEIHKMGYGAILSDKDPNCVCADKVEGFHNIDIHDIPAHIKAGLAIKDDIKAVVAAGIDAPVTQAKLAETLGLPNAGSDIAEMLHNKGQMRRLLNILQMPSPIYWVVKKGEQCPITKLSMDVVVKPCLNSGSRGLTIVPKDSYPLDLYKDVS